MSNFKRILKNASYLVISDQVSHLISMVQVVILVRYLGTSGYGVWSLVQSFPGMFLVMTDIGLNSIMLRTIAKDQSCEKKLVQQVCLLKLVLSFVFLAAMGIILRVFNYEPAVRTYVFLSSIAYALLSFTEMIVAANRARENFTFESILNVSKAVLFTLMVIMVALLDLGLRGLVVSSIVVSICSLLGCIIYYWKVIFQDFVLSSIAQYVALIRRALPFAMHNIVSPVFMQIDIIMLSKLSTFESVGIYSAAFRVVAALYFVPAAINRTLFPGLSKLHGKSQGDFEDLFHKSCRLTALLGLPAALALFVLSDKIVTLLFSTAYLESTIPLQILGLSIFFYYLRLVFSATMYASNHEKAALAIFAAGTAFDFGLDYLLIPKFSYQGAAVAALASEAFLFFGYYYFLRKQVVTTKYLMTGIKIAGAAFLMAAVLFILKGTPLAVQISLGAIVYGFFVFLFKIPTASELDMIKKLLLRLRPGRSAEW